jgi:hypothetical protein
VSVSRSLSSRFYERDRDTLTPTSVAVYYRVKAYLPD